MRLGLNDWEIIDDGPPIFVLWVAKGKKCIHIYRVREVLLRTKGWLMDIEVSKYEKYPHLKMGRTLLHDFTFSISFLKRSRPCPPIAYSHSLPTDFFCSFSRTPCSFLHIWSSSGGGGWSMLSDLFSWVFLFLLPVGQEYYIMYCPVRSKMNWKFPI